MDRTPKKMLDSEFLDNGWQDEMGSNAETPPLYTSDAFWDAFPPDEEFELLPDESDFWIDFD